VTGWTSGLQKVLLQQLKLNDDDEITRRFLF